MLQAEPSPMNPYAEINPYHIIYCNLNLKITEDVTRETAESVVKQIGYLHNALGCVFKDLVKIVSFKFPQEGQERTHVAQPLRSVQANIAHRQVMQIEEDFVEPVVQRQRAPQRPRPETNGVVEMPVRQSVVQLQIQEREEQSKQPMAVNIFQEFAYGKDSPTGNKNKDLIKLGMAKVIEGAQRKKKEGKGDLKQSNEEREHLQGMKETVEKERTERRAVGGRSQKQHNQREKRLQPSDNPMRELFSKPIDPPQEVDIFSEFVYNNNSKPQQIQTPPSVHPKQSASPGGQSNSSQQNRSDDESRLWQFLRQKQAPAIYEISDDEDNNL